MDKFRIAGSGIDRRIVGSLGRHHQLGIHLQRAGHLHAALPSWARSIGQCFVAIHDHQLRSLESRGSYDTAELSIGVDVDPCLSDLPVDLGVESDRVACEEAISDETEAPFRLYVEGG